MQHYLSKKKSSVLQAKASQFNHSKRTVTEPSEFIYYCTVIASYIQLLYWYILQSVLHKDPNVVVLKTHDVHPGPLVECEYWDHRLVMMTSLKDQLSSPVVRNILRNLEQTQSTYIISFYALQKDISKVHIGLSLYAGIFLMFELQKDFFPQAVDDAVECIIFLNTLRPWVRRLHESHDTDDIIRVFPPLLHVVQLIWRNCK